MTSDAPADVRVHGCLRQLDGMGVVRLEGRFRADVDDVWSALTDPVRLARWLGDVAGELRPGGEFRAHFAASGWEGTGRIEECEAPRRLRLATASPGEPDGVIEVTLTAADEETVLVVEDRGLPLDQIAAYGAGDQVHVEDLAAHLAGRDRCDARARWAELHPGYRQLAAGLDRSVGEPTS